MKIAVFLPNWIGDLMMATPTLRAIHGHFAHRAELSAVMRPYLAPLLAGTSWFADQWHYDPRAERPELRVCAVAGRMRKRGFDLAVLLPESFRSALVAFLGRARQRIGYVRDGRGPLLTHKVPLPTICGRPVDIPMVERYLHLAELLGCRPEPLDLELVVTEREQASGAEVWGRLGLRSDGRVVLINTGSSNGTARSWPNEHFGQLARRIAAELDHDVLVLCGPRERNMAREIVEAAGHARVFSMAEEPLDLGTAKACISRGRLMVSSDSGPRHMAAALGKPVVTLYGPTPPVCCHNPTVSAVDVRLELPCIGCGRRVCPLGHHRCMRDLKVGTVFEAVLALLEKRADRVAAA